MHVIYGALRLFALVFDIFVFYHAKDLKLIEEEDDEEEESEEKEGEENDKKSSKEQLEIPMAEHHLVPASPKAERKHSKQHKRSASREIRLIFDNEKEEGDDSGRRRSSGYMVETISGVTSNGVV